MKQKYKVYYLDEDKESIDFNKWILVGLEMCRHGLLCKDCLKDIKHLDNCDNIFDYTYSKEVAKNKKRFLEGDGFKVKIELKGGKK